LTCECGQSVDGIADNIAKFGGACVGTGVAGRYELAGTTKSGSGFRGADSGSGSLGSTRNRTELTTELLTKAFSKAFNGHLAA
jgi:hypothetical protein